MANEINERIRAIRIKKGISQRTAAKHMGMKYDTYNKKELHGTFSIDELKKMSELLDVLVEYLIHGDDKTGERFIFSDVKNESQNFYKTEICTPTFREQELLNIFRQITQLSGSNNFFNEESTKVKEELERLKKSNAK